MTNEETNFLHRGVKGSAGQYIEMMKKTENIYTARMETMDFEEKLFEKLGVKIEETDNEFEI